MAQKGADFDIDRQRDTFAIKVAYILYWDVNKNVIASTTMYSETIYPLNIVEAIRVFAPATACGANVTFESVVGTSKLTVMEF